MRNYRHLSLNLTLTLALAVSLVSLVRPAPAQAETVDLLLSEYIEGSSFNKAVEIYNGTGAAVDLTGYALELYSNGAAAPSQSMNLAGTIADGDVLVISRLDADPAIVAVADVFNSSVINFNGDDAVVLRRNGAIVDVIGQIGADPGTEWGSGLTSTLDNTIRRMTTICQGDVDSSNPFDPAVEWVGFAVDTFDGLGAHTADCGGSDAAPQVLATDPLDGAASVAVDANLSVTFSEDVNASAASFGISCTASGAHSAAVSGGPAVYTLDPDTDFANDESCTVTVLAAQVTDVDANDPPDNMAADYVFSFSTVSAAQPAALVINEIDYDQPSTDTAEFVEIRNNDSAAVDLSAYSLQMINGSGGGSAQYRLFPLPAGSLAPGDYFVVCANAATVANCDLDVDPNADLIQNGAPDAVALLFDGAVFETVSYEGDTAGGYTEGSGAGLVDTAGVNQSISRLPDGVDTNVNNVDFSLVCVTPGEANTTETTGCQMDLTPAVASTDPANGAVDVSISNNVTVNFSEPVTVSGDWFSISCANTGAHTAAVSGGPQSYVLDTDTDFGFTEQCTVTVAAANVVDQDGTPHPLPADYVFSFTTGAQPFGACGDPATFIHAIQGSGPSSPLVGATGVIIEGVVVGDYQESTQFRGFHIQEEDADADGDPATSEGVFVFNESFPVNAGDLVRLRGSVTEFSSSGSLLTEMLNLTDLVVCSSGSSVTPTTVTLPVADLADWERYEGMLITIPQDLSVTETFTLARYGEVALSVGGRLFNPTTVTTPGAPAIALQNLNDRSRILLDDGDNRQNIDPTLYPQGGLSAANTLRIGDALAGLTGVLEQRFGVYRVQPVGPISFTAANLRPAAPDPVGGRLRVAAMNVLNYFTTFDTIRGSNNGPYICGPGANLECRGANTAFEFDRQRTKIISAILGLDADVIGLMEIENNPGASVQDLVDGLNAATAPGTYASIDTGTIGTDAIKLALIYRPAAVTPVGAYAILDSSVDSNFIDTLNRPVLAQTFAENLTGEKFTVAVNHLKSKGSDCNAVGDPDLGDGQGNCNLTRLRAAEAEAAWLATDPTGSGDPDFLIIGDLNSYAKEDPISALQSAGYTNLIDAFVGAQAYSYVFQGQSGYLDHALGTATLAGQATGATEWHINADEPTALDYNDDFKSANHVNTLYAPDPYRSSDHDPVVVGLSLVPQCRGRNATVYVGPNGRIVGGLLDGQNFSGTLVGTAGDDVIVGTDAADTINALEGGDIVCALAGNDVVNGGPHNDEIEGGAGNDVIAAGDGNDLVDAGDGDDVVTGGDGDDTLLGGAGRDVINGGTGDDHLDGGAGNDILDGRAGADTLIGGEGNDILSGHQGNDGLDGGADQDKCSGGQGIDTGVNCEQSSQIP